MSGVNKALLIGRATENPVTRATQNGQVTNLTLVTNKKFKGNESSEFHRLVFFNKLSEIVDKYVHKGDQLYVEGEIQTRSYDKDGITRYSTEILCNQMNMLGSPNKEHRAAPANVSSEPAPKQEDGYDNIPF
jgi:single-strand DNA-binding protein